MYIHPLPPHTNLGPGQLRCLTMMLPILLFLMTTTVDRTLTTLIITFITTVVIIAVVEGVCSA